MDCHRGWREGKYPNIWYTKVFSWKITITHSINHVLFGTCVCLSSTTIYSNSRRMNGSFPARRYIPHDMYLSIDNLCVQDYFAEKRRFSISNGNGIPSSLKYIHTDTGGQYHHFSMPRQNQPWKEFGLCTVVEYLFNSIVSQPERKLRYVVYHHN